MKTINKIKRDIEKIFVHGAGKPINIIVVNKKIILEMSDQVGITYHLHGRIIGEIAKKYNFVYANSRYIILELL